MGFFGSLVSGVRKFGDLAGKALKPIGTIAPIVSTGANVLSKVLPGPLGMVAKGVGSVADKVSDLVSTGKAANVINAVGSVASALA